MWCSQKDRVLLLGLIGVLAMGGFELSSVESSDMELLDLLIM